MNPNINIYQSIIKQRIELAWSLKLLELQTQLIPDNQVLLNQNNQTQLLKNLINFNGIGNLANLGGLRTNNILQNPLLSLLGSNLTTSPLFSQNTFNINELFHINNTDSRNLNQNQVNESIKPIEKPQQKSELNKTKSNSEISKKIKIKQKPTVIIIDSDQSVQQCQLEKQKQKSIQKVKQIISTPNIPVKQTQKVPKIHKQKLNNKIIQSQPKELSNKRTPVPKPNQRYSNVKNTRNFMRGKKIFKEKIFQSKRKKQIRFKQIKKEKDIKQKRLKKQKKEVKPSQESNSYVNIFKEGNSKIMVGQDFQAFIPQFLFNQKSLFEQINLKRRSLIERMIHPSIQYLKMKEQQEKLKLKQQNQINVTNKLNNIKQFKQNKQRGKSNFQSKLKEESKTPEITVRITRRSEKIKFPVF